MVVMRVDTRNSGAAAISAAATAAAGAGTVKNDMDGDSAEAVSKAGHTIKSAGLIIPDMGLRQCITTTMIETIRLPSVDI